MRHHVKHHVTQRGFTMLELLIAITLLSAVIGGLFVALRNGLMSLDRVDARLLANRRAVAIDALLHNQIAGAMPVRGQCNGSLMPVFRGGPAAMLLVSSYSMGEGARGGPRILFYRILPDPQGGLMLTVNEFLFAGPTSTGALCDGRADLLPPPDSAETFTIARGLASARFLYQWAPPLLNTRHEWREAWDLLELPRAVRVEMVALRPRADQMPVLSLTVPLRVTRLYQESYVGE